MRDSIRQSLKRGGLHLALVAMMLRALLPAGWMPTGDIAQPLVICTAALAAQHDKTPTHDPAKMQEHGVCPFATLAAATPPDTVAALPTPSEFGTAQVSFAERQTPLSKPRLAASSPRAPPSLA
jgi:hypothetical protein